jgi:hypothetical protein
MNHTSTNLTSRPESIAITRKIGSTSHKINVCFSTTNTESLEDKILRLVKNNLTSGAKNVKIGTLQTGKLPGGSL